MLLHRRIPLALLALLAVGLSACTTLGLPGTGYPDDRYPDDRYPRRGPVYDRQGDYRQTPEYRSVDRDAGHYADFLDRELSLNGSQETNIRVLLERRAQDLLYRTSPRDHRYVYPFPRDQRLSDTAERWWDETDRQVNRYLDPRQRDEYRYIAGDLDRYGRYDSRRYDDRYRRGDDRYDDRYDDRGDRDGDRDDRYSRDHARRGPSYCRSGAGHPVFGREWCYDRGYYPERDYDRRRSDRDRDDDDDDD